MKRPGLLATFLMGFLPAATVGAYSLNTAVRWGDNPYVIDVITGPFQTHFGLNNASIMTIARSALQSWQNSGVRFNTNIEFHDTTPNASDLEIEAKTCCDGDCSGNSCLGRSSYIFLSDNCSIDIYMNTGVASAYSDNGTQTFDLQSIFTHEFGHCLGLTHPSTSSPEAVMHQGNYAFGAYPKRFPREDDKLGGQHAQYIADYPVRVRARTGGGWTQVGTTSGSVGVATQTDGWSLVTFENDSNQDYTSRISYVGIDPSGTVGPTCTSTDYAFDGVAVSENPGGGFAAAFRSSNDTGAIYVYRGVYGSLAGCFWGGSPQLTTMTSHRRPSLAYDAASGRLVMAFIEMGTGKLRVSTSTSAGTWTNPTQINGEWTDTSVGIDCGYWAPAGANRCFLTFPASNGEHQLRIAEGYITAAGTFMYLGTHVTAGWTLNVASDVQIVNGNRLEIIHASTNNTRDAYMYIRDCASGTCTDSNFPIERKTFVGGSISSAKLVTAAP
ncbi:MULTISPECIES: matrixin family metalloprotease [Myxococcus]|nr:MULTISPECIES: matrixin family metalloprotease [Myxococcus]NTX01679.1 matrixin family metalloprotease [Myxococcus sp. CA040A]